MRVLRKRLGVPFEDGIVRGGGETIRGGFIPLLERQRARIVKIDANGARRREIEPEVAGLAQPWNLVVEIDASHRSE